MESFPLKKLIFLETEINSLLLKGCIDNADSKAKFISPITCVPRKNGDFKLVTNLQHLNSFSKPPKFKY